MSTTLRFPRGLDADHFLNAYWQRNPLLLRQALSAFEGPLSPEELAGLACDPEVESRLVLERDGAYPWEVRHGPFEEEDFAAFPETHWTLLVQDVDKLVPEVAALLSAFRFIPDWRVDDIMVSYAADGGSVGPHVDEYDVFLVQTWGRRRWLIASEPASDQAFIPDLDLRILQRFDPTEEYLLEPGDVLYLPPGVPHWGVAEGPCMTWSVGFRAATWRELASSWCDFAGEQRLPAGRFRDRDLTPVDDSGEIRAEVFDSVLQVLEDSLRGASGQLFRDWFGRFVTEPKEHLQVFPTDAPLDPVAFRAELERRGVLERHGFSRMAFCRGEDGQDLLFANGEAYPLRSDQTGFLSLLTRERHLHFADLAQWLDRPDCLDLLCRLYNDGHYELAS
ncbi:MAG: cupin domain-containing protein [Pseudomonadota bacterium]|nr:cupin domain-containing protein [Pseudomonadota bacterium]